MYEMLGEFSAKYVTVVLSCKDSSYNRVLEITRCVCVCFLPIHSGHQVRWTYQPGSHRRKVTQDF